MICKIFCIRIILYQNLKYYNKEIVYFIINMFLTRSLLRRGERQIITPSNLQRINPLNECERVNINKNIYNNSNPLNECERPVKKIKYTRKQQ